MTDNEKIIALVSVITGYFIGISDYLVWSVNKLMNKIKESKKDVK